MAPLIRAVSTSGATNTSPQTFNKPTGTVSGDLMILQLIINGATQPNATPSGWTMIDENTSGGTLHQFWTKTAGGSEPASYDFSWGISIAKGGGIVTVRSDAALALGVNTYAQQSNASSTNRECPSVTPTAAAQLIMFINASIAQAMTADAASTEQYDSGLVIRLYCMTEAVSAGATGTRTATGASAATSKTFTIAVSEIIPDPPDAPSGLTATAITASRIDLSWTDNSNNEDNFELERSPNGTTGWTLINSPAANATAYSNTGLAQNTTYYYRIRAVNGDGNSSYSSVASALTLLAGRNPVQPRMFLLQPEVVFAARVNLPDPAEYPIQFVAYDTVTTGDYTAILPGMTLLLGTSAGSDNLGRQRINDTATPISIFVGRSSRGTHDGELTLVDNAYITVLDDYRIWAKIPFIDSSGESFKDGDLAVEWRTTTPPPVAIMGEGDARTIDPDTGVTTVLFNGQPSYATADGATITDWLWDIADCALSSGTLADDNITILCPPGFRHISLTVTDSNGKTATTKRPVLADDPDDRLSFDGFAIESHRYTDAGQTMTIRILEDMPRATYPDGTLCMVWDAEPVGASNRDHLLIVGWLDTEDVQANAGRTGLLRDTTITIQDVAQRLDTLPGFPQSVADDETRDTDKIPEITWNYMVDPTMDKYAHYLLAWHSTALEVADFYWSDTGADYAVAIKSSDGESLWQQVARLAGDMLPGYVLTCEPAGRIRMVPDTMLQDSGDRTAVVQADISEDEWSDIRFSYRRAPTVHWLRTGALVVQDTITFNDDDTVHLPTVFSIAPGTTPGQGLGEVENNEGLVASQDVLDATTGHKYARLNNPVGLITVTLVQDDSSAVTNAPWSEINLALKEWVTLTMSAETAAQRGLTFTTARCLPKELNIRYNQGKAGLTRTLELTLEVETSGEPGNTVTKPDIPAVGEQPETVPAPIPPPDMGLIDGQELVAGIGETSLYRTADFQTDSGSGGPTWEEVALTADTTQTWVVDPFSPGYLTGTGAINGWRATANAIYRIEDIFGTVVESAVVTFDDVAEWRTIQASFGTYFVTGDNPWLLCVSYYGASGGTKAIRSLDGGATWSTETVVGADYDSGGASNPIGLYCSPKTPGLAYTAAHIETADPAETSGFVSYDWGETWAEMAGEEDPERIIRWGLWPPDSGFELHGEGPRSSNVLRVETSGTLVNKQSFLVLAPPATAVRVTGRVEYTIEAHRSSPFTSAGATIYSQTPSGMGKTFTNVVSPGSGYDVTNDGSYDFELTWSGSDWPEVNADTIISDPPASPDEGVRWYIQCIASGNGSFATGSLTVSITEIELADSTIYTPTFAVLQPIHGQGGTIGLPWEDNDAEDVFLYGAFDRSGNREFALMRAEAGVVEDISPNDGSRDFGINHGHFAVRCHDSDRSLVVAAVTGNDTSGSTSGDYQAIYTSVDGGDTWAEIIAPTNSTEPFSAAWSGELDDVLFCWGPAGFITFSDDAGANNDDRSGNLSALSATAFRGIAGGPTP